jgi:hypothetical protein
METGSGNRRDLMPPGAGEFRPAVAKQNQRTFALFEQENVDPVGGDHAGRWHRFSALFARFCRGTGSASR